MGGGIPVAATENQRLKKTLKRWNNGLAETASAVLLGVSANHVHGFERVNLQNLISLLARGA
jgi:hypothetical protein